MFLVLCSFGSFEHEAGRKKKTIEKKTDYIFNLTRQLWTARKQNGLCSAFGAQ